MLTGTLRAYRVGNAVGCLFFVAVGTVALDALLTGSY
jgi:hypothetical protein